MVKTLLVASAALLFSAAVTGCTATKEETTADAAPIDKVELRTNNSGTKSDRLIFLKSPGARSTDAQKSESSARRGWKITEKQGSGDTKILILEPETKSDSTK